MWLIFGNSAGNSIAFGSYVMVAAGDPQNTRAIRGLAVTAFTVPCLLHLSWRRGGLLLNNVLALMKVALLLMIIGLGFAALGGASFGHRPIHTQNFDDKKSFSDPKSDIASYADSFLYIIMSFHGFKQPFYVRRFLLCAWLVLRRQSNLCRNRCSAKSLSFERLSQKQLLELWGWLLCSIC